MRYLLLSLCWLCAPLQLQAEIPETVLGSQEANQHWNAVGRLDFGDSSFCTGSLISPVLVLTAAHCLYDIPTKQLYTSDTIQFRAGLRDGEAHAYRGVKQFFIHPDFAHALQADAPHLTNDIALIELKAAVNDMSAQPFLTTDHPQKGAEVSMVSYAHDHAETPSVQEVCEVLARQASVLVTSCQVDYGASGAPIFAISGGVSKIVSVVSAKAYFRGFKVTVATSLETALPPLLEMVNIRTKQPVNADGDVTLADVFEPQYVAGEAPRYVVGEAPR